VIKSESNTKSCGKPVNCGDKPVENSVSIEPSAVPEKHFYRRAPVGLKAAPDDGKMTQNRGLPVFPYQLALLARPGINAGERARTGLGSR
jgi:hypothetical protein